MHKPKTKSVDMRWFRLYHDALDDEKVQELRPDLFKFWVNLLCLASRNEPRGRLPSKDSAVAFKLRVEPSKAAAMLAKLEEAGLIDRENEQARVMHNWDNRQPASDNGAARQQAHRNRHRNVTNNVTGDVTDNDAVTARARGEQEPSPLAQAEQDLLPSGSSVRPPLAYPPDCEIARIENGRYVHTDEEAAAFFQDVWQAFGNESLANGWYQAQRQFSLPAWRAAFAEAKRRKKPFRAIGYVARIADDFDDSGQKKAAAAASNGAFDPDPNAELNRIGKAAHARYGDRADG